MKKRFSFPFGRERTITGPEMAFPGPFEGKYAVLGPRMVFPGPLPAG
jgi:hypothetical protein